MGYNTEFDGEFTLSKSLDEKRVWMLEKNIVQWRWQLLSLLGDLEMGRLGGGNAHDVL